MAPGLRVKPLAMSPSASEETLRVLLVEDMEDSRSLISLFLRRAGARVDTARNGREGLEMALAGDYDVVDLSGGVPGTLSPWATFTPGARQITWEGALDRDQQVQIDLSVQVDDPLPDGTAISLPAATWYSSTSVRA